MDRDYGEYSGDAAVIEGFEAYEESLNTDFGETFDDFGAWFLIYRHGFFDGVEKAY